MIQFNAELERFNDKGEKTGWHYLDLPEEIAEKLKPGNRQFFRVRGQINGQEFRGLGVLPMGEGGFILPLKAGIRRQLKVEAGAMLHLLLEEDKDFKILMPPDLELVLSEEPTLLETFQQFNKANQNYFINWINGAKTETTRTKRIALTIEAMELGLDYGAMIRHDKARRQRNG